MQLVVIMFFDLRGESPRKCAYGILFGVVFVLVLLYGMEVMSIKPVRDDVISKRDVVLVTPQNGSTPTETTIVPTTAPEILAKTLTLEPTVKIEADEESDRCCLYSVSVEDLMRQYPSEFIINGPFKDNNKTYENWLAVVPKKISGNNCIDQWNRLCLQQTNGHDFYFPMLLENLASNEKVPPYYGFSPPTNKAMPRALFLGDSVSHSTFLVLLSLYVNQGVYLAGAPRNCFGFADYYSSLSAWLGPCTWDFVQFNVGMHFHPQPEGDWRTVYRKEILAVVQSIHAHSPFAKIAIAFTTPSPLDTNATTPLDDGSCPHLHLFHKTGLIASMNNEIWAILQGNETIPGLWGVNDRYSLMVPHLSDYQLPCDVHYGPSGYERLAQQDWEVMTTALNTTHYASDSQ
jgi:hypothetical protein